MCPLVIKCDLEYWGLDELLLEPCCALKYYPEVEICVKEIQSDEIAFKKTKVSERMSYKELAIFFILLILPIWPILDLLLHTYLKNLCW